MDTKACIGDNMITSYFLLFFFCSIAEKMRIAGSMVFIFLLFILTAILVKVKMNQDQFFSVTMATIWFINSRFLMPYNCCRFTFSFSLHIESIRIVSLRFCFNTFEWVNQLTNLTPLIVLGFFFPQCLGPFCKEVCSVWSGSYPRDSAPCLWADRQWQESSRGLPCCYRISVSTCKHHLNEKKKIIFF